MRNEFSGTADAVAQVQHMVGDIVYHLPAVPIQQPRTPHEVPAADPHFVNRRSELSRLLTGDTVDATSDAVRIAVFSGLDGIGKTAFVRRVAADTAGKFDGGELFVDFAALRRDPDGTVPLDEAVGLCLQSLGVERRLLPASLAERVSMYRTWTADQRLLVVLDDVTEPAQVRALIPTAPGSAVLATSSTRMGELVRADGAELVMLEPLDDDSARAILIAGCGSARIGAEPDSVDQLIRLCEGLPLALRVAGARLAQEPFMTVRDLLDEIEESLDGLSVDGRNGVQSVLTTMYRALEEDARQAYRLLGASGIVTFTAWTVSVLLDVPLSRAKAVLRALSTANLVVDLPHRQHRFLGLVRRHAAGCAEDEGVVSTTASLDRLLASYLVRAVFADWAVLARHRLRLVDVDALVAGQADPFIGAAADAEAWVGNEWQNLMAVLGSAVQRGRREQVWQFAELLAGLSLNTRRPADLIKVCQLGAGAAGVVGRLDVRARLRALASRGHMDLGQVESAGVALDGALADAGQYDNPRLLASIWEFRGRYLEHVDRRAAEAAYRRCLALNEAAGERRGAALAVFFLAGTLSDTGAEAEALVEFERTLHEFRALGDERMAARVLVRLGRAYTRHGDLVRATQALTDAVRIFAERNAGHYEVEALEALADVAERVDDRDGAVQALTRAVAILEGSRSARADTVRARLTRLVP